MARMKTMRSAVRSRDAAEIYETLLINLAAAFDETDSARDKASLAIRIIEVNDRLIGIRGDEGNQKEAEVTGFEVIAGRRASRGEAAEG